MRFAGGCRSPVDLQITFGQDGGQLFGAQHLLQVAADEVLLFGGAQRVGHVALCAGGGRGLIVNGGVSLRTLLD